MNVIFFFMVWQNVSTFGRSERLHGLTVSKRPIRKLQNHAWVKDPFKVQKKPMNLSYNKL